LVKTPVTPRKNAKAFGGSGIAMAHEWFDSKLPNCIDFDKAGGYFTHPLYDGLLAHVEQFPYMMLLDGDTASHPNMVRIPESLT